MYTIPASELTLEKLTQRRSSGEHSLRLVQDMQQTVWFNQMMDRLLFRFAHHLVPSAIETGRQSCLVNIFHENYSIPPWILQKHSDILLRVVVGLLSSELKDQGYTVSIIKSTGREIQISWGNEVKS